MQENFLPNEGEAPSAEVSIETSTEPVSGQEFVKVMVIGSRKGINMIIKLLHHLRFVEVREWTPLIPDEGSGEMMSLVRKKVSMK